MSEEHISSRNSSCSAETRDALRRARELAQIVPISDMVAFAALQLQLGHDMQNVRRVLQLDAYQFANIRQRLCRAALPTTPKRGKVRVRRSIG